MVNPFIYLRGLRHAEHTVFGVMTDRNTISILSSAEEWLIPAASR